MNLRYVGDPQLLAPGPAFPGGVDKSGFPPALVMDADFDRLRSSGTAFAAELAAAGTTSSHVVVRNSLHGFLSRPWGAAFAEGVRHATAWLARFDE